MKKILLVIFTAILMSCSLEYKQEDYLAIGKKEIKKIDSPSPLDLDNRKWTILVYMSADNNLESSAMEDIREMECSMLNTDAVTVLILLDRSASYDTTNGNWSGTRLYQLKTGRTADNKQMISEEVDCPPLDLACGKSTELDMSSDYTMSNFITYCCDKYPAEKYGFIIWGHGTGWRGEESALYKGFAYDETSNTYMTLHQMGNALKNSLSGNTFDFLGFDTCFGGELEVMYELKDYADFCVGSEGLLMSSGWDYQNIFNSFQQNGNGEVTDFCDSVINSFSKQYAYSFRASIAEVKMSEVKNLFDSFDNYSKCAANLITSRDIRDDVLGLLYTDKDCKTDRYTYGTSGNDVYLDMNSAVENLNVYLAGKSTQIDDAYKTFTQAYEKAVPKSWASDKKKGGLGIFFSVLGEGNLLSANHPSSYIKNKTINQILFVKDSCGYVPFEQTGCSFLDKLFYTSY